ncbi:MAG TPA: heavy metal-associated domain-containing protein, partial [Burkholderiaceae bacterium]
MAPPAGAARADELQLLDDPQEWPVFGRPSVEAAQGGVPGWESHVVLEGMHCAACALTIEQALVA